jgi:hypothetical protein
VWFESKPEGTEFSIALPAASKQVGALLAEPA